MKTIQELYHEVIAGQELKARFIFPAATGQLAGDLLSASGRHRHGNGDEQLCQRNRDACRRETVSSQDSADQDSVDQQVYGIEKQPDHLRNRVFAKQFSGIPELHPFFLPAKKERP